MNVYSYRLQKVNYITHQIYLGVQIKLPEPDINNNKDKQSGVTVGMREMKHASFTLIQVH